MVSGFGFWISGFGSGFRDNGLGIHVSGQGLGLTVEVDVLELRAWGLWCSGHG
jgi:hypothetical protein